MRDNSVAAESVVLLVDIPHDLTVGDGVISVLHVATVALIEAIAQKCHHGLPDRLLVVRALTELLQLAVVYPGDDTQREYTELLHPVLLNDLLHSFPVHRHFPLYLYLNPGIAIVVIGYDLNPGAVFVIIGGALHPCAVVVIPDRRITVGQLQIRALGSSGAGIVASEIGAGRAAARTVAPQAHGTVGAVPDIRLDDVRQVDVHPSRAGFHLDTRNACQQCLSVGVGGAVVIAEGQGRGVRRVDVYPLNRGGNGQRALVLAQQSAQVREIHPERTVGGVIKVIGGARAGAA